MKTTRVLLFVSCSLLINTVAARSKYVEEGEDNPYEFGFTIDGQQHRHEKKDANGIIQGEFGFITADGVYHVTVYATDEDGNFKILSMRNVRISGPLDEPNAKLPDTSQLTNANPKPAAYAPNPLAIPASPPQVQAITSRPAIGFTTQPTIKPACAGCGYVTQKPGSKITNKLDFQTPAFNGGGPNSKFPSSNPNQGNNFPLNNRGNFPGSDQGNFPGSNQGNFPGSNQGNFPGSNQGNFPGSNQGNFPGNNPNFPGANQGNVPYTTPLNARSTFEGVTPSSFQITTPNNIPGTGLDNIRPGYGFTSPGAGDFPESTTHRYSGGNVPVANPIRTPESAKGGKIPVAAENDYKHPIVAKTVPEHTRDFPKIPEGTQGQIFKDHGTQISNEGGNLNSPNLQTIGNVPQNKFGDGNQPLPSGSYRGSSNDNSNPSLIPQTNHHIPEKHFPGGITLTDPGRNAASLPETNQGLKPEISNIPTSTFVDTNFPQNHGGSIPNTNFPQIPGKGYNTNFPQTPSSKHIGSNIPNSGFAVTNAAQIPGNFHGNSKTHESNPPQHPSSSNLPNRNAGGSPATDNSPKTSFAGTNPQIPERNQADFTSNHKIPGIYQGITNGDSNIAKSSFESSNPNHGANSPEYTSNALNHQEHLGHEVSNSKPTNLAGGVSSHTFPAANSKTDTSTFAVKTKVPANTNIAHHTNQNLPDSNTFSDKTGVPAITNVAHHINQNLPNSKTFTDESTVTANTNVGHHINQNLPNSKTISGKTKVPANAHISSGDHTNQNLPVHTSTIHASIPETENSKYTSNPLENPETSTNRFQSNSPIDIPDTNSGNFAVNNNANHRHSPGNKPPGQYPANPSLNGRDPNDFVNPLSVTDSPPGGITVTKDAITVPNHPPIPIQDKFPNMVDGLPEGISKGDITDLLYKFNYTVGFQGHYEKGYKNGAKVGGYFVNDRDGVSRIVTYVADENGYRPKVKFIRLDLNSDLVPKEGTEKTFGLKNFEFVWYPIN